MHGFNCARTFVSVGRRHATRQSLSIQLLLTDKLLLSRVSSSLVISRQPKLRSIFVEEVHRSADNRFVLRGDVPANSLIVPEKLLIGARDLLSITHLGILGCGTIHEILLASCLFAESILGS